MVRRLDSLDNLLAVSLHNGCLVLVEGEEVNRSHFRRNYGEIPVHGDVLVEVRVRAGRQVCLHYAGSFDWKLSKDRMNQGDIISWRYAQ